MNLVCEKCGGPMSQRRVYRLGGWLVGIGYLILAVSLLVFGLACLLFLGGATAVSAAGRADEPGAGLAFVLGTGGAFLMFLASAPGLIVGLLLVLRRKVWRCGGCGYLFERG